MITMPLSAAAAAPLSLKRNFSWTLAGNVIFSLCQWGIVVAYAKLTGPEEVGRFALGVAIATPAIVLSNLSLRSVIATDARHEFEFQDYLWLRLVCTAIAVLGIAFFACLGGSPNETKWIIVAVALAKAFESISDIIYGQFQSYERMDRIAVSMILRGILSLAAVTATVAMTRSALWGSCALAGAWLATLALFDVPGVLRFHPRFQPLNAARIRQIAYLAMPLGLVTALISFAQNIPRYFIVREFSERELGIFSALAYFAFAGAQAMNALGQSASPRLARYYAQSNAKAYLKLLAQLVGIGALLGGAGVVFASFAGKDMLRLLYTAQYAEQAPVLKWLMIATLTGYLTSMVGYGVTAARIFRIQLPIFMLSTAATAAGCAAWVHSHGALGAAWAMTLAAVVNLLPMFGCLYYAMRKMRAAGA